MSDGLPPSPNAKTDPLSREHVQRTVLRRITSSAPKSFIVRGGILMHAFIGQAARPTIDLDFLSTLNFDPAGIMRLLQRSLVEAVADDKLHISESGIDHEITWAETASPGLRIIVTVEHGSDCGVQPIDIGFNDPTVRPPVWREFRLGSGPAIGAWAVDEEQSFAWKFHELFEKHTWHFKHVYDLNAMLDCCQFDELALVQAIQLAFESRGTPVRLIDRLLDGNFGQSRHRGRRWRTFRRKYSHLNMPEDHLLLVKRLAEFIRPFRSQIEQPES